MLTWIACSALASDPTSDANTEPAGADDANAAFDAALVRMFAAIAAARDATFDLHQQEWVGRLRDPVVMHVRYRAPNDLAVTWDNGQRLLWLPGQNGDKMRVDPGPWLPTVSLAPDSALARRGQRHTVERMGLQPVAELFAADRDRILADPALTPTVTAADRALFGRAGRCFDAVMRKDLEPALYASRVEVCFDAETGLPLQMTSWDVEDGAMRMVERYGYENLQVDIGLGPEAFDPDALGL